MASALSVITEITFNETETEYAKVKAFIDETEAQSEDTWTKAMIAKWDTKAAELNRLVACVGESIDWYEISDSEIHGMYATMQEDMKDYAEFRAYVKECKGW